MNGPGLYEFLIDAELQQYYNPLKNDLKVLSVAQLKYVSEDDMSQIGMTRPEIRRLKKYFHKYCPQTYLAKMKKKLLSRKDDSISISSLSSSSQSLSGLRNVGRHIIQADSIVIHKTLGYGEFGTVQQGVWTSDDGQRIQVAIKCLSQERMENNPVEFLKEAAIMHTIDHEHVVRLYGVVLDTSALMLVTELAILRSLLECLKEPSMRPNLTIPTLYDYAIQICSGMQYLESKRLIHRDLACRNILVFSRSKVKISDFGLSRALGVGKDYYQTNFNVNLKLPIAWCAPECINFLRFTSFSDIWAYGVTLWEMFSYGFQPWAALTGQQILEAIDEPNYQRLEKPECAPNEIYQIMVKCWNHDPQLRPTFAFLANNILPEAKPVQVQTIQNFTVNDSKSRREFLVYEAGEIITVLDRPNPNSNGDDSGTSLCWKGVLKCGKTGLFHPENTITYLGSLPGSAKQTNFMRNDSRSSSMRSKGRLSTSMISAPQGDLVHTGHIGTDGQFFGDITFLGSKCWSPKQVNTVPPYKPENGHSSSSAAASSSHEKFHTFSSSSSKMMFDKDQEQPSNDTAPLLSSSSDGGKNRKKHLTLPLGGADEADLDHEYQRISDEENEIMGRESGRELGLSNPALSSKSQSPLDSPRFGKSFDLGGPSLIDEVFDALKGDDDESKPDETNIKNELKEMARSKKKFATVKPISSSDRRTLDHAIAIANELASRSMLDLDRPHKFSAGNNSMDDLSSPRTPTSPSYRKKFAFILGGKDRERRNYSQEAQSIADIQSTLTEESKEAYNSLIEKPSLGFLTPTFENKSSFHFEKSTCSSKKSEFFDTPSDPFPSTSHHSLNMNATASTSASCSKKPKSRNGSASKNETTDEEEEEIDSNPLRLLRANKAAVFSNILPLPPRTSKNNGSNGASSNQFRHQRKHPLLLFPAITKSNPPPPPPKPLRNFVKSLSADETVKSNCNNTSTNSRDLVGSSSFSFDNTEIVDNDRKGKSEASSNANKASTRPSLINVRSIASSFESDHLPSYKIEKYKSLLSTGCNSSKNSYDVHIPLYENFGSEENTAETDSEPVAEIKPEKNEPTPSPRNKSKSVSPPPLVVEEKEEISHQQEIITTKTNGIVQNDNFTIHQKPLAVPLSSNSLQNNKNSEINVIEKNSIKPNLVSSSSIPGDSTTATTNNYPKLQNSNFKKVQTVQRILGSSATEEDCQWALDITKGDAARAVKLLRLKSLLPESIMTQDIERVVSVLEMSFWDVARARDFLLDTSNKGPTIFNQSSRRNRQDFRSIPTPLDVDNEYLIRKSHINSLVVGNSNEAGSSSSSSNGNSNNENSNNGMIPFPTRV